MPPRKESYIRGSCQYGDRGKFHHVSPQPSKPKPFGFGIQTGNQFQQTNLQMQKTNPFGFGAWKNPQTSKHNKFKPFENKGICFSPVNASNASASRQPNNQSHKCTDPESRKWKIIRDFEQERPLWKLTCSDTSESSGGDNSIWMKSEWSIGEIPEEEPPNIYCK